MNTEITDRRAGMMIHIAIVETDVLGVLAFHAKCVECGWRCHKQPHPDQATAIRHAEKHICKEK